MSSMEQPLLGSPVVLSGELVGHLPLAPPALPQPPPAREDMGTDMGTFPAASFERRALVWTLCLLYIPFNRSVAGSLIS